MPELKPFPGVAQFLFGAPLYETFSYADDDPGLEALFRNSFKIDGHCPFCGKTSTFTRTLGQMAVTTWQAFNQGQGFVGDLGITCARDESHVIRFNLRAWRKQIRKAGQYPSFADIANDESKQYRTVLSKEDAEEFHKAIGLAAHGVGIGSYVYIRRIFERLIHNRFEEWKDIEKWKEDDFQKLRMSERIELLRNHLPEFLVRNKKLYSILSLGVHELNEQDCLGFFEIIRASTVFILEEDKRKKEELAQRAAVEKAIAQYAPPGAPET